MNLIEAIKSGKRFRRKDSVVKSYVEWHSANDEGILFYMGPPEEPGPHRWDTIDKEDLLADWEIEESEVDKLKATIEELNIDIWSLKEQNKRLANDYQEMKQRELLRKR